MLFIFLLLRFHPYTSWEPYPLFRLNRKKCGNSFLDDRVKAKKPIAPSKRTEARKDGKQKESVANLVRITSHRLLLCIYPNCLVPYICFVRVIFLAYLFCFRYIVFLRRNLMAFLCNCMSFCTFFSHHIQKNIPCRRLCCGELSPTLDRQNYVAQQVVTLNPCCRQQCSTSCFKNIPTVHTYLQDYIGKMKPTSSTPINTLRIAESRNSVGMRR